MKATFIIVLEGPIAATRGGVTSPVLDYFT